MTMYYVLFIEHSAGAILIPGQDLVSRQTMAKRSKFCHIGFQGKHKKNKILRHKMKKLIKNETVKTQNILLMLEQQCRWLPGSRSAGV